MKEKKIILTDLTNSINQVKLYCENEKFKGWDPYDGLNSLVFKLLKINKIPTFRWVWIQFFKRFPFNMRKFFLIKKGYNPKAIALILSAYCNLYKISSDNSQQFGKKKDLYDRIIELTNLLLSIRSSGYSGDCWGYNFDWQARHLFFSLNILPLL